MPFNSNTTFRTRLILFYFLLLRSILKKMPTIRQGMSSAEIEQIVAQRVNNAIKAMFKDRFFLPCLVRPKSKPSWIAVDDFAVEHIMRTQALEAGAHIDTLEDTGKINAECYRARYRKEGDDMQHFENWIRGNLSERYLMPVELGSFNAIIGMDWLRRHRAMIVYDEKLVRVPFGNETLVFRGAESYIGRESRLTVISCSKVQEYRAKGCHVFLAQISATKEDDKPEGKHVKDVPIVQDFPEVFHENMPRLPPARPVEFQIDLIPGAAPVARAPYRLAPSEMKELSEQLQELSDK
nr:reverse transcriptase domain-containing protein [Tanacetum cinerariifolium]